MELCKHSKINGGRLEENILAILDASEARDTQDADDDRTYYSQKKKCFILLNLSFRGKESESRLSIPPLLNRNCFS